MSIKLSQQPEGEEEKGEFAFQWLHKALLYI
jgi:hypothetical protein